MKESCRLVCGHIARQTSQGHVERTTVTRTSLELVEVWTRVLEVTGKFEVTEATGMGGITCGRERESLEQRRREGDRKVAEEVTKLRKLQGPRIKHWGSQVAQW